MALINPAVLLLHARLFQWRRGTRAAPLPSVTPEISGVGQERGFRLVPATLRLPSRVYPVARHSAFRNATCGVPIAFLVSAFTPMHAQPRWKEGVTESQAGALGDTSRGSACQRRWTMSVIKRCCQLVMYLSVLGAVAVEVHAGNSFPNVHDGLVAFGEGVGCGGERLDLHG